MFSCLCHSFSNGTATVYLFFVCDTVVFGVVLASCMDSKDRNSSGLGDLNCPLVSDVTRMLQCSIPEEVCSDFKFVYYGWFFKKRTLIIILRLNCLNL